MADLPQSNKNKERTPLQRLGDSYRKATTGSTEVPEQPKEGFFTRTWEGIKDFVSGKPEEQPAKQPAKQPEPPKPPENSLEADDDFKAFKQRVLNAPTRQDKYKIQFDYQKSLSIACGTGSDRACRIINDMKQNGYWVD